MASAEAPRHRFTRLFNIDAKYAPSGPLNFWRYKWSIFLPADGRLNPSCLEICRKFVLDKNFFLNSYVAAPETTVLGYKRDVLTLFERRVSIPTTVSTLSVSIGSCNVAATYLSPLYRHPYALYVLQQ